MLHTEYVLWPVCLAGRVTGRIVQGRCPASELPSNPSLMQVAGLLAGLPKRPKETERMGRDEMGWACYMGRLAG